MSSVRRLVIPRRANEAVDGPLTETERQQMIAAAAGKFAELFDILHIDHQNDHNTRETPLRVARMFVDEIMRGRFSSPPALTEFDNVEGFSQMIVIGPIDVRSTCAHHLMPIYGDAYLGVLPSETGRIIGLSKYDRIVDHFCGRPQIQEELVKQIGQFIMDRTAPCGVAVRISAVHMCKTHRGVRSSHRSRMVTNAWFGALSDDHRLQSEFLRECASLSGP
ncbi:MAG: GTP cyclohydrolase I [Acetobacteraceae bacterium]